MDYISVNRPWGHFEQLTHNELSTVKLLYINKGESLSLQYHNKRNEFWKVISGNPFVEIDDLKVSANVGDTFNTKAGSKHRLSSPDNDSIILEISTGDFDEDDIIRLEDKYNRIGNAN